MKQTTRSARALRHSLLALTLAQPVLATGLTLGMDFGVARRSVIKQGWRPTPMHAGDGYVYSAQERAILHRGMRELDSCAMDRPYCVFYYQRHGECLALTTNGEQPSSLVLASWRNECPDEAPLPGARQASETARRASARG
ncbi:hypothetical protein [Chitinimonas sp.]|uniref:hypothetical protein n=1 Tax=Chitinimonas sp. TaxID=1934313 RepID=UPI002F92F792